MIVCGVLRWMFCDSYFVCFANIFIETKFEVKFYVKFKILKSCQSLEISRMKNYLIEKRHSKVTLYTMSRHIAQIQELLFERGKQIFM